MATKNFSVVWTPGKTVSLTFKRKADNKYWTGSAWQSDSTTVEMTEVESLATGYSEYYSTTAPDAPCFWWAVDDDSNLASYGEYDPAQTTAATSSDIAPTTANLKEFLQIPSADTDDDTFLENCANRAGDFIENYCQRRFNSSERTYIVSGSGSVNLYLPDWPITAVTSIHGPCTEFPRAYSTEVDSDYYVIANVGYPDERKDSIIKIGAGGANSTAVWSFGNANYQVIATTGYSSLPSDLAEAAIELASHLYNLGKHARLGLSAKSVDGGNLSYELERGIPYTVRAVLNRYKRWAV